MTFLSQISNNDRGRFLQSQQISSFVHGPSILNCSRQHALSRSDMTNVPQAHASLSPISETYQRDPDCFIDCQDRSIGVHRHIISKASYKLASEYRGDASGVQPVRVRIRDYDYATVQRMIVFIYHGQYNIPEEPFENPNAQQDAMDGDDYRVLGVNARLIIHTHMYAIAIDYDVPALKYAAVQNFKSLILNLLEVRNFMLVVYTVYASATGALDCALRVHLGIAAARNIDLLMQDGVFRDCVTHDVRAQGFAVDLLQRIVNRRRNEEAAHFHKVDMLNAAHVEKVATLEAAAERQRTHGGGTMNQ